MRLSWILALPLLASCSVPTSIKLDLTDVPADAAPAPLFLSIFDSHRALVTHLALGTKALPLTAVAYNLPDKAETVRVVVTRAVSPRQLGGQALTLVPYARVPGAIAVSATTRDSDGDGIPDNVDNCPNTPNPDQASSFGGAGDACSGGGDMAAPSPPDMAVPSDMAGADLFGGVALYNFSYTLPKHRSLYYGGHDKPPATIGFTSSADSVSCSHDGVHFVACDSPTTIVFTPDDYNNGATLSILLQKAGLPGYIESLNPQKLMPNLHFFNCDVVLTNSESTAMFQQQLLANRVLCLASGATVNDVSTHVDDAGMPLGISGVFLKSGNSTGMKILGTESNPPTFFNPASGGNQGIFISQDTTVHDMVFSNLILISTDGNPISFESNGGRNAFSNLTVSTGGSGDVAAFFNVGSNDLYNVNIHVDGSGGTPGIQVGGSATVSFTKGQVFGRDDTPSILVNGGVLTFDSSTVDNGAQTVNPKVAAVQISGGLLTVTGPSVITGLYNGAIAVSNVGRVALTGTTVTGAGTAISATTGGMVTLSGATVTTDGIGVLMNTATLTIDNTTIARLDQNGTAGPAISVMANNTLNSTANGNLFCDKNLAGSNKFSGSVVNDAASSGMYLGTFTLSKQMNMGNVGQCP